MKIATFHNFNFNGSAQLPNGNYKAVGIAPGSWVDTCIVGGNELGVGSLVPYANNVIARRGLKVRYADGGNGTAFLEDQLDKLSLVLYEDCDALIPPGPRAPVFGSGKLAAGAMQVGGGTLANLMFRLPFFGRRMASFRVRMVNDANDCNIVIRGLKYVPREIYAGGVGITVLRQLFDEQTDTLLNGATAGLGTSSAVSGDVFGPGSPTDPVTGGTTTLGRTLYLGGVDNMEDYDEVQCWVYGASVTNGTILYAWGEAFGERIP